MKRLKGAVFFNVTREFDTGLVCKLMALTFPSYLVKFILYYLRNMAFVASIQGVAFSRRGMRAGMAYPLQSLYK